MRPIFTKLQKNRQRVDREILDLLEDSEPSAKRVARWFGIDLAPFDPKKAKLIRDASAVRVAVRYDKRR